MLSPEIENARNRLKNKFKSTRTGGKGSVRRKRKNRVVPIGTARLEKEDIEFNHTIDQLNTSITALSIDEKELWESYLEDYIVDTVQELSKKDIRKKSPWTLDKIVDGYADFYKTYYFEETMGYSLFTKNRKFLQETYSEKGYEYQVSIYKDLCKILHKQEYKSVTQAEPDKIEVTELLELLALPIDNKPSKEVLKKAYWKKSLSCHPDKHPDEVDKYTKLFSEVERAYHNIQSYYYPSQRF